MTQLFLYHQGCNDGYSAAMIANKYFKEKRVEARFYSADPDEARLCSVIDELIKNFPANTPVVSFDLAFTLKSFKKLTEYFQDVQIIDHHETTKRGCLDLMDSYDPDRKKIRFDKEHSAAVLAFHYYFPDEPVPKFLLYIEDRDLFRETQPNSKIINAGLYETLTFSAGFDAWERFLYDDQWICDAYIRGSTVLRVMEKTIASTCKSAKLITIKEHQVYVINTTTYMSDIGAELYNRTNPTCDYVLLWRYDHGPGSVYVSLRSKQGTGADVEMVAKRYGGGGHKHASGFQCSMKELMEIIGMN